MDFNINMTAFSTEHRTVPLQSSVLYDVIIIGGGPAALTAAVYCMRKGVKTGLIAKDIGGQVGETSGIENYLGYKYIEGHELVNKFAEHVKQFEIGFKEGIGVSRIIDGKEKSIILESGEQYRAKAIILATGSKWKKLNVPGEDKLIGKGVAYCAICDAPFFAEKRVVVVGGGNSGVEAAIDLAKVATSVTVVQFLDALTADKILLDKLKEFSNVKVLYEHAVERILGEDRVSGVAIVDRKTQKVQELKVDGIFIQIGLIPNSEMAKGLVEINERGEIIVDCACRTSAEGIFAAGDVTSVPYKQIIIAAGEGAKAALSACDYVMRQ
ncbi:MAG: FAD-dependent oxidoreductase [Spirochaetes bacterium]|nr:FAD-dependent oxidoreductase [Spirochaetota bacterium]